MAKIGIDCDGVICDFIRGFVSEANHMWPGKFPKDYVQTKWNFEPSIISADEVNQVWERIKATPDWWMTLNPHAENVGALAVFLHQHYGHDVWIVTSRVPTLGSTVAYQTYLWVRACGVESAHNYLGVLPVENWHDKRRIYKAAQFDFSVDDKLETVMSCDDLPDHKAYLLSRPWNQDAIVKRRINSLAEFFAEIK